MTAEEGLTVILYVFPNNKAAVCGQRSFLALSI